MDNPGYGDSVMEPTGPQSFSYKGVYYSDYLKLDDLLDLQKPESASFGTPAHEETLFIITHQTYELWFKQILHELDSIITMFSAPYMPDRNLGVVTSRLHRVNTILKVLVEQFSIIESMDPMDFLEFRAVLQPASGFQSVQFRLMENKLGMSPASRIQFQQTHYHSFFSEKHRKQLDASERSDTLFKLVGQWLERMPYLNMGGYCFWDSYKTAVEKIMADARKSIDSNVQLSQELRSVRIQDVDKNEESFATLFNEELYNQRLERGEVRLSYRAFQATLFIFMYKDEPICALPHLFLSHLTEIDENISLWRYRHSLMVQRMIGVKIGTGGSSGYHYLRTTVGDRYKIFIDIFNAASYLIPRAALPRLPDTLISEFDGSRFTAPQK